MFRIYIDGQLPAHHHIRFTSFRYEDLSDSADSDRDGVGSRRQEQDHGSTAYEEIHGHLQRETVEKLLCVERGPMELLHRLNQGKRQEVR